jgi:endonuclease/exonuclease/phosphatase family metal-dependent hydrolase
VLRIMTYNVHRCLGLDGRLDVSRIAAVIAESQPDIVALQELDVGRARTRGVDQAHAIAEQLGMSSRFNASLKVEEELYGDAIMTALPERLIKAGPLPGLPTLSKLEPRGAVWVAVEVGGVELHVVNTHLGLLAREQAAQIRALMGPQWLGGPQITERSILLGDFNSTPGSTPYKMITRRFQDAQATMARKPLPTFPSVFPMLRIDHVFMGAGVEAVRVGVPATPLARTASDHLPLVVDVYLKGEAAA